MIEPLRYHNETATTYEVERPAFCVSCQSLKSMEKNPNIAVVYCVDCPGSFVPGNKSSEFCGRGAFLCKNCENDKHKHGLSRDHKRQILVVGPGLRKKIVVRGDGMNFPMVLDKVEVSMKARIYHNGKRVHREPTREIPFVVGMSGKSIHVQILGARNLRCSDMNGTADPFVVYSFCGKPLHTTRVRHRTLNPRWDNETIVVPMDEHLPVPRDCTASQKDVFRLEVFDKDFLSQNEFLGQIEMHRSKLMKLAIVAQEQPIRIPLTSREIGGLLHVQLAMTSQAVFIKVCAAEDLDKRDVARLNNAYVKVFLGDPENTLLGMTPVIKHVIHPIWSQHNVFSVSLDKLLSAEAYIAAQVRFYRATHGLAATTSANTLSNSNMSPPSRLQGRRSNFVLQASDMKEHTLDEFNLLPDFLGLFRFEVHDQGSGLVPIPLLGRASELLGHTAIHVNTLRKHLPQLPAPLYNEDNDDNNMNNNKGVNDLEGLAKRSRRTRRFSLAHNPTVYAMQRSMSTSMRGMFSARRTGNKSTVSEDEEELGNFGINEDESEENDDDNNLIIKDNRPLEVDVEASLGHLATHPQETNANIANLNVTPLSPPPTSIAGRRTSFFSHLSPSRRLFANSPTSKRFHFGSTVSSKALSFLTSQKLSEPKQQVEEETPIFGPLLRLQLMRQSRLNVDASLIDTNEVEAEEEDLGFIVVRLLVASRGSILQGLDLAVQRMTVGETAHVKCRFDLAYGSYCLSAHIPPRACVIFTVTLLSMNGRGRDMASIFARMVIRMQRIVRWMLQQSVGTLLVLIYASLTAVVKQLLAVIWKQHAQDELAERRKKRRRRRRRGGAAGDEDSNAEDSDNDSVSDSLGDSDDGYSDEDGNDDDGRMLEHNHSYNEEDEEHHLHVAENHRAIERFRTVKPDKHMQRHLSTAVRAGGSLVFNYPVKHHETVAEKRKRQLTEARALAMQQQRTQQLHTVNPHDPFPNPIVAPMQSKSKPVPKEPPHVARSMTSKLRLLQQFTAEEERDALARAEKEENEEKDDYDMHDGHN